MYSPGRQGDSNTLSMGKLKGITSPRQKYVTGQFTRMASRSPQSSLRLPKSVLSQNRQALFSDRLNREKQQLTTTSLTHRGRQREKSRDGPNKSKGQRSTLANTDFTNSLHRFKEERRKFQQKKCCRIIVIQKGGEDQHFISVERLSDIMQYLRTAYPKVLYYKCVPTQLTLDYLLMHSSISGQFINGQTLYIKPCEKCSIQEEISLVELKHFEILKQIGSGGFSKVYLARFRGDGRFYAVKIIEKEIIIKNKKKRIIMNERNIMKKIDHPFLIEMRFSFETERYLVFAVEYCVGGELFGLIKQHRRLSQTVSKFYIIEILLGLSYLHDNQVIYRDIKPQNILIGQDGHIKIADLGLAKPDMFEGELAYSFCGSPEYMAPEMIMQVGHTYPVDYYCMGALLYELITGLPPYYRQDPEEIYEAVISEDLTFPEEVIITPDCKSLLKGLLNKDSKQRLGSMHGVKEILAHPWFGKNNYQDYLSKNITPPFDFSNAGSIDLEVDRESVKKDLDELKIEQAKTDHFKPAMKNFYYDWRGGKRFSVLKLRENSHPSPLKLVRAESASRRDRISPNNFTSDSTTLRTSMRKKSAKQLTSLTANKFYMK